MMLKLMLVIICSSSVYLQMVNYCDLTCERMGLPVENSACNCKGFGPACESNAKSLAISREVKMYIVALHNQYRENVAAGEYGCQVASNMETLIYDDHLQHVAQCYANKCIWNHDKCRSTQKFKNVGQNMFKSIGDSDCESEDMFKRAVESWFSEITDANEECLSRYQGCAGHFTQMIWAKTTHVGCGIVSFGNTCQVVCNYGPTGNVLGSSVYKFGTVSCETDKKYKHLCKAKEEYVDRGSSQKLSLSLLLVILLCTLHFIN